MESLVGGYFGKFGETLKVLLVSPLALFIVGGCGIVPEKVLPDDPKESHEELLPLAKGGEC